MMKSEKGQATVFLSIILLAVIVLTGILVDASRVKSAEVGVKNAVNSATKSTLAGFNSRLKKDYGIFALSENSEEELAQIVREYVCKNLMIPEEDLYNPTGIDLYGYRIENLRITPVVNLTENKVVRKQILQYMKYRAPERIIEGLWDKLAVAKEAGKLSTAYKTGGGVDNLAGEMDKLQEKLKDGSEGEASKHHIDSDVKDNINMYNRTKEEIIGNLGGSNASNRGKKADKCITSEQSTELPSNRKVQEGGLAWNGVDEEHFAEEAFAFFDVISRGLPDDLSKLKDEIYINEYIMETFKSAVPAEPITKDTFFDSEIEYILQGNASQNTNESMTKTQILLVRFALNTLHAYTDSSKRALAIELATATSGWWTGGVGIPIATNLILCSWGMGEALIDIDDLMNGKSVPFFKTKDNWKLDIKGLPKESMSSRTDSNLSFSYNDYLRLLLLMKNSDEKINRIEDLIQLNIQKADKTFKMSEHNTYLRVEAVISMNYLFLTQPFMPPEKKTLDGKHKITVVAYQGY